VREMRVVPRPAPPAATASPAEEEARTETLGGPEAPTVALPPRPRRR
jgi:hypothetical protein